MVAQTVERLVVKSVVWLDELKVGQLDCESVVEMVGQTDVLMAV
jgi:hypothetical protein